MFGLKKKEKTLTPEEIAKKMADDQIAKEEGEKKQDDEVKTGDPKLDIEITKIKAQLEGLGEARKISSDRFTRIGEQIGELRGMIVDTQKSISTVEVSSTKAVDLVESVQPEKLMIEVRKLDGKIESVKANVEANETLMKDLMAELKKMRQQMNFYKGVEQVAKMLEDMKHEITESKRIEANMSRHADKVDTIFLGVSKKFAQFDKFNDIVKDLQVTGNKMLGDFDKMKMQLELKESKKEFVGLVNKFNDFEKHTGRIIKLLDDKTKHHKKELDKKFDKVLKQFERKTKMKFDVNEEDDKIVTKKLDEEIKEEEKEAEKVEKEIDKDIKEDEKDVEKTEEKIEKAEDKEEKQKGEEKASDKQAEEEKKDDKKEEKK